LADLEPARLAVMHGSSYEGDCATLLRQMADVYEERYSGARTMTVPEQGRTAHEVHDALVAAAEAR
ncbi:MAG TPA: hypothetical protein VFJ98_03155, partial [Mycobacteriales bacterium]|nr:hypothetical protein [Mycobacteriales bacterium]